MFRKRKQVYKNDVVEIDPQPKHMKLRIAAFVLAFIVSIAAFGTFAYQLTNKKPGYYTIQAEPDEFVPLYANGITFNCYLTGSGNEIKDRMNNAKAVYSQALLWIYKTLDSENTYEGFVNIATINQNPEVSHNISKELAEILSDALLRSSDSFSIYSGLLFEEWNSILHLNLPEEFDPIANEDEEKRIAQIIKLTSEKDNFRLELGSENTAKLLLSDKAESEISELELKGQILDLNQLKDAYILRYVKSKLESNGFTAGYLTTDSGLCVSLSGNAEGNFYIYDYQDGKPVEHSKITMPTGGAVSVLRNFPLEENVLGYYTLKTNNRELLRHPNINQLSGEMPNNLVTAAALSYDGDVVLAAEKCLALFVNDYPDKFAEDNTSDTLKFEYIKVK